MSAVCDAAPQITVGTTALTPLDLFFALSALERDLRENQGLLIDIRQHELPGDLVVETEKLIGDKRERVERFRAAWLAGCRAEAERKITA